MPFSVIVVGNSAKLFVFKNSLPSRNEPSMQNKIGLSIMFLQCFDNFED